MKLKANKVPYSSVVGGGLMLIDENGIARFIINFMGATEGITKEENNAMSERIANLISEHGLEVPNKST